MIETHVVNTFLATAVRAESWFAVLNYFNGLVAPSFLFIAGFVQGMSWSVAPGKPVAFARRARHLLGIGAIGYALHFPWTEIGQHRWEAAWRIGSQVDVLQCIAASLGLLLIVTWLAQKIGARNVTGRERSPSVPLYLPPAGEMVWWIGVTALLALAVFPAPLAAHWNPAAIPLRAWVNFSTGSWFPLFPWAGFVFVGALTGAAFRVGERAGDASLADASAAPLPKPRLATTFGLHPAALLPPLPLALSAWAWSSIGGHSPVSPASFLERTAWALALAALCQWLAARRRLPSLVLFAGKHSLTLYVAHLVLISSLVGWGVPGQAFSIAGVLGLIAVVAPVSLVVTWLISRLRGFHRG